MEEPYEMDTTQILIFRACKSSNPEQRLQTLYRRHLLHDATPCDMVNWLLIQIEELLTISTSHLFVELRDNPATTYEERMNAWIKVIVTNLRHQPAEHLQTMGFKVPRKWK